VGIGGKRTVTLVDQSNSIRADRRGKLDGSGDARRRRLHCERLLRRRRVRHGLARHLGGASRLSSRPGGRRRVVHQNRLPSITARRSARRGKREAKGDGQQGREASRTVHGSSYEPRLGSISREVLCLEEERAEWGESHLYRVLSAVPRRCLRPRLAEVP
jgi:hypothetical protein